MVEKVSNSLISRVRVSVANVVLPVVDGIVIDGVGAGADVVVGGVVVADV